MAQVPYASVLDSLMYVMMCTQSNICYTIRLVSRFQLDLVVLIEKQCNKFFDTLEG